MNHIIFAACLVTIVGCSTPAQTSRALADLDLAYSIAAAAEAVYVSLPNADPAVVVDLRNADLAARDALAIAHAAAEQGDMTTVEATLPAVRDALVILGKIPARP